MGKTLSFAISCCAALGLMGCNSVFGLGDRDGTVSLSMQRAWDPPPVLQVDVEGLRRITLTGQRDGMRVEREVEAPRSGELLVAVRLLSASGDTIAATQYLQRFERSKTHWIAMLVGSNRPLGHCLGTLLVLSTIADPDTAFIMHGGLPEGAIC